MSTQLIDSIIDEALIKKQLDSLDSQLIRASTSLGTCAVAAKNFNDQFANAKGINDIISTMEKYNQTVALSQKAQTDIAAIEKLRAENAVLLQKVEQQKVDTAAKLAAAAAKQAASEQVLVDAEKALIETLGKSGISVDKLNVSKSQAASVNKLVTTANNSEKGSREQLNAIYELNYKAYSKLSSAQRETTAGKAMQVSIKAQSDALLKMEKDLGNNHRAVGDYGTILRGMPGIFGEMADKGEAVLVKLRTTFGTVKDATMMYSESVTASKVAQAEAAVTAQVAAAAEQTLAVAEAEGTATAEMTAVAESSRAAATEAATVATNAGSKSMSLFKIALASTGIGLIIVLLGSLVAWFKQTHEGTETLEKITNVLGATFKMLTGYLAKAVQGVVDFFDGIKSFPDLLSKVGDSIKEHFINWLNSFSVMGKAIVKILSGDIKGGFKDLANGVAQNITGVTDLVDKFGNVVSKVGADVKTAMSDAAKITEMEQSLDKFKSKSIETIATLEKKKDEYTLLLGKAGQSATTKEREDAMNNLIKTEDALMGIKMTIARRTTAIKKAQLDLENKQSGDAQLESITAFRQAKADEIKLQGEYEILNKNVAVKRAKLYQQILTEEVSAEQSTYDQNKAILNAKMSDENLSATEKLKLFEKIKIASNLNSKSQEQSFQDYVDGTTQGTKKIIDFNELLKISDGAVLSQRMQDIGLSKLAQAELLKILNARKSETLALSQDELKLMKELSTESIKRAKDVVNDYISENEIKIASHKITGEQILKYQVELDQKEFDNEVSSLKMKLDAKIIKQEEYDRLIIETNQKRDLKIAKNNKSIEDFELNRKSINLNNQLEIVQGNVNAEYAVKLMQLKAQEASEIKIANETGASILLIKQKYAKLEGKLEQDKFKEYANFAIKLINSTANAVQSIGDDRFQGELDNINKLKTANTDAAKKETDEIAKKFASGILSKQEADAQSAAIDAQKAARDLQLAEQEKQTKRKQAEFDKEIAIFNIIINTAAAIVSDLGNPLMMVADAVAGALELAIVVARPIPAYKDGTQDHVGGLANVGDGFRSELALTPDGNIIKTPAIPTIMNLPAHTKVFPDYDKALQEMAFNASIRSMNGNIPNIEINAYNDALMRKTMGSLVSQTERQTGELGRLKDVGRSMDNMAQTNLKIVDAIRNSKKSPWVS